jgi:hypothetical protein
MATWGGAPADAVPALFAQVSFMLAEPLGPEPFLPLATASAGTIVAAVTPPVVATEWLGQASYQTSGTFDFFEDFHVLPRSFDFGNILSDQSSAIEVFSGFRRAVREWTSFTSNAGVGVTLVGGPTLPADVNPLTSLLMTLEVSATGEAFVDATLEFVFDSGDVIIEIDVQRIVLWGAEPERAYEETLAFLTDVLQRAGGKEQRFALRKNPRQVFSYRYLVDEGEARQVLENLMFEWQSRVFGVPVWWDDTELTADATAGDLSITVTSTDYRDFRVGGLVAVFVAQDEFDVVEISSLTSTTIGLTSALVGSYDAGTKVYPLAVCRMRSVVRAGRFPANLSAFEIDFTNTENDANLADVTPFESFNSKVLITENSIRGGVVTETFERRLTTIDSGVGLDVVESDWAVSRRGTVLTVRAVGRQAVWELRGLIHALRGRQVSFYLARGSDDLAPVANLTNGGNTLDVANYGYAQFVNERQPRNVIRVSFVSGATPLLRTITASTETSATVEQLTLNTTWPATYTPAQVARIEFVEKVRFDADDVRLEFDENGITARMVVPVKVVLE